MKLTIINKQFCVCKVDSLADVDFKDEFCFLAKTDKELSLVCPMESVPQHTIAREDGWSAFRIEAVLDFSLVGILAEIATVLANENISIFAISTYDTDYILVKQAEISKAIAVLEKQGYALER